MDDCKKQFFDVLNKALMNVKCEHILDYDLKRLYGEFKKQNLICIFYRALVQNEISRETEYFKKTEKEYKKFLLKKALQENEINLIKAAFEENEIKFCILKGDSIAELYPLSDMRQSCDIDLLIGGADLPSAEDVLNKFGFEFDSSAVHHLVFKKKPLVTVELHTMLVPSGILEGFEKKFNVWERLVPLKKYKFEYEFKKEDLYIYMLAHFAAHLASSGGGIRYVLDLWLFIKKYSACLDNDYVENMLEEFKMQKLASGVFEAGNVMFGGKNSGENAVNDFIDYMFESGIVGNLENFHVVSMRKGGRKNEIMHQIFPKAEKMKKAYPILEKHGWLLPFIYVWRGVKNTKNITKFKKKIEYIERIPQETIGKTDSIYKYLGL